MRRLSAGLALALIVGCAHPSSTGSAGKPSTAMAYTPSSASDRELLPDEQIQQVLNRLAFGGRPGDAVALRSMGVDAWIQRQLNPESIPDDGVTKVLAQYPTLVADRAEMFRNYQVSQQARQQAQRQLAKMGDSADRRDARMVAAIRNPDLGEAQQMVQRAVPELQTAMLTRAVVSDRQLYEVMVNFWENHFSVFAGKGQQERVFLTEYDRDVIRPNALGNFRTLLGAVAHSPAMMFYLDNWQSQADSLHPTLADLRAPARRAGGRGGRAALPTFTGALSPEVQRLLAGMSPEDRQRLLQQMQQRLNPGIGPQRQRRGLNENYARELMELHTLGVEGGYTQTDVMELARVLSGWSIAVGQGGEFIFRPEWHDASEKTVLGHKLVAGRGEEEGNEVLDMLARHPATARFITTKLARHFISDAPPQAVIDRCSAVFTKTDGDIRQTVGCIVTGPEFFSRAAYRSKVKTPFQVVASALRAINAVPDATPRAQQTVTQLGQPIFGRQTPDGWPDRGDAWMNTGAILGRINFGITLASGRVPGITMTRVPELEQLRTLPRDAQVDGVVKLLFGGQVSTDTRQVLLSGENPLLSKLAGDSSAAMARGNDMGAPPPMVMRPGGGRGQGRGNGGNQQIALEGLAQIVGLALGAPEFQRR